MCGQTLAGNAPLDQAFTGQPYAAEGYHVAYRDKVFSLDMQYSLPPQLAHQEPRPATLKSTERATSCSRTEKEEWLAAKAREVIGTIILQFLGFLRHLVADHN